MFSGLRGWEPIIILVVVLLLFGARRLPDLARSIGTSAREFRQGLRGDGKAGTEAGEDASGGRPSATDAGGSAEQPPPPG